MIDPSRVPFAAWCTPSYRLTSNRQERTTMPSFEVETASGSPIGLRCEGQRALEPRGGRSLSASLVSVLVGSAPVASAGGPIAKASRRRHELSPGWGGGDFPTGSTSLGAPTRVIASSARPNSDDWGPPRGAAGVDEFDPEEPASRRARGVRACCRTRRILSRNAASASRGSAPGASFGPA